MTLEASIDVAIQVASALAAAGLGHAYAGSGKKAEAQELLSELKELSKQRYVPAYDIALIYAGLGEKDQAFDWLKKAYCDRSNWMPYLKLDPRLSNMRSDPRFQDLLRRVGLAA